MAEEKYGIIHAALTDIGLKRSLNEDSLGFIEIKDGYVFIVCDGMGGHEGGEIASKAAVGLIIEYLNTQKIENVSVALHQAITFANQQIYMNAQKRPDSKGMGTTVVLLLIYKDEIYTAHVGDSRMYVLTDNQFIQLTKDHSVVQDMVDNGVLSPEEAENHPRKNEITRALGIREEVMPTISNKALKAKAGDRFVICSDGLSGLISTQLFSATVQQKNAPDECARELITLAKKGGGDDNITVQIIDISQSPFTESFYPQQAAGKTKPILKEVKKRNNTRIAAIVAGLAIIGILFGFLLKKFVFNKNINPAITEQTSDKPEPKNVEELTNDGYITSDSLANALKLYLGNKNGRIIDSHNFLDSIKKKRYAYLKANDIIEDFTLSIDSVMFFKLDGQVADKLYALAEGNSVEEKQQPVNEDAKPEAKDKVKEAAIALKNSTEKELSKAEATNKKAKTDVKVAMDAKDIADKAVLAAKDKAEIITLEAKAKQAEESLKKATEVSVNAEDDFKKAKDKAEQAAKALKELK